MLTPLDYERHPLYTLVLNAFWMDMVSVCARAHTCAHMLQRTEALLHVYVVNVNDNAPVFTGVDNTEMRVTSAQLAGGDTRVGSVRAIDNDADDSVYYSLINFQKYAQLASSCCKCLVCLPSTHPLANCAYTSCPHLPCGHTC